MAPIVAGKCCDTGPGQLRKIERVLFGSMVR
ncbi:hypothetical protein L917_06516 [Phytophthora nicotianae]|uniref:Uncharacterized protein n=1 Tax=Phytophthora nicotianae TaxID=4792 RepID=W2LE87_PHYNI|nr:hypothetical protein L915_22003 [Phytophthora nicotianae]ETL95731.1 hypothetical protein L917_06516 [Phytophthora nicotianae]